MNITFLGNNVTLNAEPLKVGDQVKDFTATDKDLNAVSLTDLGKGIKVLITVPSLDTPVCDMEVRKFNVSLSKLTNVSAIYVVSMDLPFAQSRFCTLAGIDKLTFLSDYKDHSFAHATSTYVKELGLLTRSVLVIDEDNKVIYAQYLDEITHEPNYEDVLEFLSKLK
jgi:hypothetical protein